MRVKNIYIAQVKQPTQLQVGQAFDFDVAAKELQLGNQFSYSHYSIQGYEVMGATGPSDDLEVFLIASPGAQMLRLSNSL